MVTTGSPTHPDRVERRLAIAYATPRTRGALSALLALDDTLADILRGTREPMVGQMRLTWWHGALTALDTAPPPAQPVLQALAADVVPLVTGAALAAMIEGWEELLEPDPLIDAALLRYADGRGGALFAAMADVLGGEAAGVRAAGAGWAFVDLADNVSDATLRARCLAHAQAAFDRAFAGRWPRPLRPLGAFARLASDRDLRPIARFARLLRFRWTGL